MDHYGPRGGEQQSSADMHRAKVNAIEAVVIIERVPITLLLNILSVPLIYIIAIAVGVRAATQRGESFDVGSGLFMLALWSIPTMLAGVLLIGFFASDQYRRTQTVAVTDRLRARRTLLSTACVARLPPS